MHVVRMPLPKSPKLAVLLAIALLALVLIPDVPSLTAQELFPKSSFDDRVRGGIEDRLIDLVKIARLKA